MTSSQVCPREGEIVEGTGEVVDKITFEMLCKAEYLLNPLRD